VREEEKSCERREQGCEEEELEEEKGCEEEKGHGEAAPPVPKA
jgi:hypothetical protein